MESKVKKIIIGVTKVVLVFIIGFSLFNIYEKIELSIRLNNAQNVANISIENYANGSSLENKASLSIDYDKHIQVKGSVSDSILSHLKNRLDLIPKDILSMYFEQGGIILVTDENISEAYYRDSNLGKIIGLHDARKNIVYIENTKYAIDSALIHEFGHVLDSLTGWSSMDDDFKNIFNNEKDTFEVYSVDGHYKANEREFFAEVFQEIIINFDSCTKTAPNACNFVQNKISEL